MGKTFRNKGGDKKHGGKNRPNGKGGDDFQDGMYDSFRFGKFDQDDGFGQKKSNKRFDNRGK